MDVFGYPSSTKTIGKPNDYWAATFYWSKRLQHKCELQDVAIVDRIFSSSGTNQNAAKEDAQERFTLTGDLQRNHERITPILLTPVPHRLGENYVVFTRSRLHACGETSARIEANEEDAEPRTPHIMQGRLVTCSTTPCSGKSGVENR